MKLDSRIEKLSDILTCVDIEEAKQFINQNGYFADHIELFENLADRRYGTLVKVIDDRDEPFYAQTGLVHWTYFLPECRSLDILST